jgi:2-succinyl-6-hydroxy-2,4-cyclohexadiene-1-carboxylate synthase
MTIRINGYSFHVSHHHRVGKPLICFLHGFLGSADDWTDVCRHLYPDFSTLCIDLPGHGHTRVSSLEASHFSMANIADALTKLVHELGYRQAYLTGYSMGGRLALYMALHYADTFTRCVLESSSPGLKTTGEQLARKAHDEELAQKLKTSNFSKFLENWYNQPLFRSLKVSPSFSTLFQKRLQNNPGQLALVLENMGTGVQPSLWTHLSELKIPVLVLAGEKDEKFIRIGREMSESSELINTKIVSRAGHLVHVENEAEFLNHLYQFFL